MIPTLKLGHLDHAQRLALFHDFDRGDPHPNLVTLTSFLTLPSLFHDIGRGDGILKRPCVRCRH